MCSVQCEFRRVRAAGRIDDVDSIVVAATLRFMYRISVAATVAALAFGGSAHAGDEVWEAGTTVTGGPRLAVHDGSVFGTESYSVEVFRCPNGGPCEAQPLPFTAGDYEDYGGRRVDLSSAAGGDAFEARFSRGGVIVKTERTPPWLGNPTLVRPPSVTGRLIEGAVVSGDAGVWAGGWSERWQGSAAYSLAACRRPTAVDCVEFSPFYRMAKLEPRWTGWYVFATSTVFSGHHGATVVTDYAYPSYPNPRARLDISGNQAISAAFGPIQSQPPTASIRAKALRTKGRLSVGRVNCPRRCTVRLTVKGGGKTIRRSLTVTGTKALRIPVRRGRLTVTVSIGAKQIASGVTRGA